MTDTDDPREPPLPPQSYSPQAYPPGSYPTQSYPTDAYWARPDPTRPYPAQSFPTPSYPQPYPPAQLYPQYQPPPPAYPRRTSSTGPAAFAFGFLALAMGWVPLFGIVGIGCGVAGVVFAMKALELAKLGVASDRGLAITGMVLSCIGIGIGVVVNLVLLVAVATG